jgi:hypothetical protein
MKTGDGKPSSPVIMFFAKGNELLDNGSIDARMIKRIYLTGNVDETMLISIGGEQFYVKKLMGMIFDQGGGLEMTFNKQGTIQVGFSLYRKIRDKY